MTNLTSLKEISHEFRFNDGVAYVSIRGAARIVGCSHPALVKNFSGNLKGNELSQKLIEQGFEPGNFSGSGIPDTALALIIEYYAFDANRKPAQAKVMYRAMAAIGIRTWIKNELGVVEETAIINPQADRLRELELQKEILEAEAKLMATKRDYDNWSHMIVKTEGEEYLARLRGQLPPAPVVIEKQIPVDSQTGRPIQAGNLDCSVKSILKAAGLDDKSARNKKIQERFKLLIKQQLGVDLQAGINTEVAYFANFYDVVPEDLRDEAIALAQQFKQPGYNGKQGNLFVHGLQQSGLILHPDFR